MIKKVTLMVICPLVLSYFGAKAQDCVCTTLPFWGDVPGPSIRIGVSFGGKMRVTKEVQLGLGVSVGLTLTWEEARTASQKCICREYCCPDQETVRPTVIMSSVPIVVEMPDPLIPTVYREETRTVNPAPLPDKDEWICEDCLAKEIPQTCMGTRRLTYSVAGVQIGFSGAVSYGGMTLSVEFTLPGTPMPEVTILPSPCRPEESLRNRPPVFVDVPGPLCLAPGKSKDIVLRAYDPDGPEDIVAISPSMPWPEGLWWKVEQDRIVRWRPDDNAEELWVREVTFIIGVAENSSTTGGILRFDVVDTHKEGDLREVPIEVIQPIEISAEDQKERWEWVRTSDGSPVFVLVQEFTLVIKDPNPLPAGLVFTYCVKTKYGRWKLLLDGISDLPCRTSYTSTARCKVTFIPDPEAEGTEDEVIVEVSHYRCGIIFAKNGFPVKVRVNAAPKITISLAQLTTYPGASAQAVVTATDPDGDALRLIQTSGPGAFAPVEGVGAASGTWTWKAKGYNPWQLVFFEATDQCGASSRAYLLIHILLPPRVAEKLEVCVRKGRDLKHMLVQVLHCAKGGKECGKSL